MKLQAMAMFWFRHSSLNLIVVSLPLLTVTLAKNYILLPFVSVVTLIIVYKETLKNETYLYSLTTFASHAYFVAPIQAFIAIWGILVALYADRTMMLTVVSLYALVLVLAIMPGLRFKRSRQKRWVPFMLSYTLISTLFLLSVGRNFLLFTELL